MTGTIFARLTRRELQVARGLALGLTNREIATEFGISIKTIDTHRGHILDKLELRNNVELAHAAIAADVVQLKGVRSDIDDEQLAATG